VADWFTRMEDAVLSQDWASASRLLTEFAEAHGLERLTGVVEVSL